MIHADPKKITDWSIFLGFGAFRFQILIAARLVLCALTELGSRLLTYPLNPFSGRR